MDISKQALDNLQREIERQAQDAKKLESKKHELAPKLERAKSDVLKMEQDLAQIEQQLSLIQQQQQQKLPELTRMKEQLEEALKASKNTK